MIAAGAQTETSEGASVVLVREGTRTAMVTARTDGWAGHHDNLLRH